MEHTENIVIELVTPLPCMAGYEDGSRCGDMATKSLGTMESDGQWVLVPLCDGCWQQVESQLVRD